jgi:serine/threonine-protein kinase RsbW
MVRDDPTPRHDLHPRHETGPGPGGDGPGGVFGGGESGGDGIDGDVVELTVPALTSYLGVVRTATAGLAARLSFTLDEIEDLRIAVDEACVMLLSLPGPHPPALPMLTCRFTVDAETLSVTVSAQVNDRASLPAEQSFAWQVLTAHVTEVAGRASAGRAAIDLVKRRRHH